MGPQHPNVAASLYNLAGLCKTRGNFSEAVTFYKRALEIREITYGQEHKSVVPVLRSLAKLYKSLGQINEGQKYSQKAKAIQTKYNM